MLWEIMNNAAAPLREAHATMTMPVELSRRDTLLMLAGAAAPFYFAALNGNTATAEPRLVPRARAANPSSQDLIIVPPSPPPLVARAPDTVLPVRSQRADCFLDGAGAVLSGTNFDAPLIPASQTKTAFSAGVFEALLAGRLQPDTMLTVRSHHIAQHGCNGPKIRLTAGDTMTVRQAALLTYNLSHNGAAAMLAEASAGGDLDAAIAYTNDWAQRTWTEFGYEDRLVMTRFLNATGMPRRVSNAPGAADLPLAEQNRTTLLELMTFARVIQETYPEQVAAYFGVPSFTYRGVNIYNSNRLLENARRPDAFPTSGVTGGKTGLIEMSGANLLVHYQSPGTGAEYWQGVAGMQGPGRVVAAARRAKELLLENLGLALRNPEPILLAHNGATETPPPVQTTPQLQATL